MSTQPSYDHHREDPLSGLGWASFDEGADLARVTPRGELDLATAPELGDVLAEAPDRTSLVILDLSELTFMDSSGLQVILTADARLDEADCRLVLVPGDRQVQRIFEITGTEDRLEFINPRDASSLAAVRSS
jgi:anti-sigma B factor antagonist